MKLTKEIMINTLTKLRDAVNLEREVSITGNDGACAIIFDSMIYSLENNDIDDLLNYTMNYRAKSSATIQAFVDSQIDELVETTVSKFGEEEDFFIGLGISSKDNYAE